MADKDDGPDKRSAAYNVMAPRWDLINTLLGGTESMRSAGEYYLPKHQEESDNSHERRLAGATLLNMTELTLDMLAGKPFADPVRLGDDASTQHEVWAEDMDMQGNNIDVFARRWFRDGIAKGMSHVLIDMPRKEEKEDGTARTLADDKAENIRPYVVHLPPECVIFMSGVMVNGREVLDHVRIAESELVRDGWGEALVQRIRVLELGTVEIWELKTSGKDKDKWVSVDSWETDLDYIPLVTFYTDRQGLGLAKPPLQDLAYMNVRHWQLEADLNNIVSVACFPMLAMSGVDSNETGGEGGLMKLGPNQILATRAPEGKFYYVEHTGTAISTGMKQLGHTEEQMSAYGAQFLREKPGDLKATVRALDSAESLSQLQAITLTFRDAVETVLRIMGDWADVKEEASVDMSVDFGLNDPDESGWQAIEGARKRREISRSALLTEMQRRGWMADDYDADADKELLEAEAQDALDAAAKMDLDPGAPDDPDDPNNPTPPKEPDDE